MKHLKQNGYSHDPKALINQFRSMKKRPSVLCVHCGEKNCRSKCESVSFLSVFIPLILLWALVVAASLGIAYARESSQPQVKIACNGAEYKDKFGNLICAEFGQDLGRGIKSNWEAK